MGSAFQDTDRFPKLSYFAWNLAKVPHTLSVYPSGSKLGLFSLYRQRFPRYGSIFKLAISGHDTGHWQSFRNCTLHSLFLPQGVEIELSFPRYRPIFKLPYLGMKLGNQPKVPEVAPIMIYSLSTPWSRNWAYFCSMGSGFRDTGWYSKLPYLGMKLRRWQKVQKFHIY